MHRRLKGDTLVTRGLVKRKSSSVQSFLEALGVKFEGGNPQPMSVEYGYYGKGGWSGNYRAVEKSLIGQDATKLTSLIDWSKSRYARAINDKNQFGIDVKSGATVRMSREATSYQRALVAAGILSEEDVIIGRF